jgi:hypothetical protein
VIRLSGTWRSVVPLTVTIITLTLVTSAQDEVSVFKTQAASAFVWGQNNISGVVSSSIQDPLTGNAIRSISHDGITVNSRAGFKRFKLGRAGELLSFTTTIVNHTESRLSVRQGRAIVDGRNLFPLPVVASKGVTRAERDQAHELASVSCFSNDPHPDEVVLSSSTSSNMFSVIPGGALTISLITQDPRYYALLCSVEGCYPKGAIRFYVTVNSMDFVFVWAGREMAYCEK